MEEVIRIDPGLKRQRLRRLGRLEFFTPAVMGGE
jgi:hypothetical protein